jgi:hypothetical protein
MKRNPPFLEVLFTCWLCARKWQLQLQDPPISIQNKYERERPVRPTFLKADSMEHIFQGTFRDVKGKKKNVGKLVWKSLS